MESSWFVAGNILLALLTVAASGVVATVVSHRLSVSNADRAYLRTKAEELFLAFEQYAKGIQTHALLHMPYVRGGMNRSDLLDLQIKRLEGQDGRDHDRVQMLISIYFPDLEPALKAFIAARDQCNTLVGAFEKDGERATAKGG